MSGRCSIWANHDGSCLPSWTSQRSSRCHNGRMNLPDWKKARVHIDYHVEYDKHYYSVPHTLMGQEVDVRATEKTVEIFHRRQRASLPCSLPALPGRFSTQQAHMPPAHQAVAGWSAAAFSALGRGDWPPDDGTHHRCPGRPPPPPASLPHLSGFARSGQALWQRPAGSGRRRALTRRHPQLQRAPQHSQEQAGPTGTGPTAATPLPAHAHIRGQTYYN